MQLAGHVMASIVAGIKRPDLPRVPGVDERVPPEALADADSRFVDVRGVKVHKQYGYGPRAIVLLHSLAESVFTWRQVAESLAEWGTVVAFDRPAHGLTERVLPPDWPGYNPYTTEAQADMTIGLMDALGIRQAVLIGNSAGGTVAVMACLRHPERVQALVLVSAAVYQTGAPGWLARLLAVLPLRRVAPHILRWALPRSAGLLNRAWHDASRVTAEQFEGYKIPLYVENWDRAFFELIRASRPLYLARRLHEVIVPVLL